MKSAIAIAVLILISCSTHGVLAAMPDKQNDDKPAAKEKPAWEPTDHYRPREIDGWTVLVNKALLEKDCDDLRKRTLRLLEDHLYRITRVVPADASAKLQKIRIWVERADPKFPCMCYHESEDWLRDNGVNPEKVGGVELANPETFLDWTHEQPWMVLHELAHGYHAQVL